MRTIWEKIRTRWPCSFRRFRSLSSSCIFPLESTRRSAAPGSSRAPPNSSAADSKRKGWLEHFLSSTMMFSRELCEVPRTPLFSSRKFRVRM